MGRICKSGFYFFCNILLSDFTIRHHKLSVCFIVVSLYFIIVFVAYPIKYYARSFSHATPPEVFTSVSNRPAVMVYISAVFPTSYSAPVTALPIVHHPLSLYVFLSLSGLMLIYFLSMSSQLLSDRTCRDMRRKADVLGVSHTTIL